MFTFLFMALLTACGSTDPETEETGDPSPGPTGMVDTDDPNLDPTEDTAGPSRDSTFSANGYGQQGPWLGYLFTNTDSAASTIDPACAQDGTDPCFSQSGPEVCVEGTVAPQPDFSGFAAVGWHLNQAIMPPNPPGNWTVTGSGVEIEVLDEGGSTLRAVVQSASGDTWCKELSGSGRVTIPWNEFLAQCWEGAADQTPLSAGTAIQFLSITVPGTDAVSRPFAFCWIDAQFVP